LFSAEVAAAFPAPAFIGVHSLTQHQEMLGHAPGFGLQKVSRLKPSFRRLQKFSTVLDQR
jgi:hypothetical protein